MKIMNKTRQQLSDIFLQGLKEEKLPWRAVWDQGLPRNAATLKEYRGVNNLVLSIVGMLRNYEDPRWCTFLQAKQNGWRISKGANGVPVEYWAFVDPKIQKMLSWKEVRRIKLEEPDRMEQLVLRCRISTVFNAADIIGIPEYLPEAPRFEVGAVRKQRDTILRNMRLSYEEYGNRAYYSPAEDKVVLPPERSFESTYGYLCTFLHECGHASAHPSRLNRALGERGTENYAREELRAEIASAFASQALHLKMEDAALDENLDLHKAYIQGWIGLLENRPQELFEAIRDAEKISDYLLAMGEFSFEQRAAYLPAPIEITAGSITFVLKNCWAHGGYYLAVNGSGNVREEDCTRALRPYRAHISELHIAEGITEIGNRCFQKMPALQFVALPHSLQRIGHWGFDGCDKLNTVEFSGSIPEWDAVKKGTCFLPKRFSNELSRAIVPFDSGLSQAASAVRTNGGTLQLISQDVAEAEDRECSHTPGKSLTRRTLNRAGDFACWEFPKPLYFRERRLPMASLRDTVREYLDDLRSGIAWLAFWREGRSWHGEAFHLDMSDYLYPEDKMRLAEIQAADPKAVVVNGYYSGYLGEEMSVDELAAGVRHHYENGLSNIAPFMEAHDDALPPEILEEARAKAHEAGRPFYERPYNGEDIDPYVYDGNMSVEDYELMHRLMEQGKERSERVNEVFSIQLHNRQLYEQGKDGVWLDMPTTTEQLQAALRQIGISADNPQDFFINGYSYPEGQRLALPYDMVLAADVDELNFLAARLGQLDAAEIAELNAALQNPKGGFENIDQIIDFTENVDYYVHLPDADAFEEEWEG